MSEELLQTIPQQIGKYTYYRLGATTLGQLVANGLIPKKAYEKLKNKKPDGLVTHHGQIKAVVEYKQPKELNSEKLVEKAIAQEIEVAKALCKLLIVTDGSRSFWVNALNGQRVHEANGKPLAAIFHPFVVKHADTLEFLLDEVTASLSASNSTIRTAKLIDPTPLATRLWQTIWVATGKSPVKCLYNVVELFIFKFLSDLKVLPDDVAFANIYAKSLSDPEEALEFYATNTRKRIYKLFPAGEDGTTIINGTIFVTEKGEPNLSQAILFQRSLAHLNRYGEEFGSLTKIDKQFKTKLYESFLKQEVEALGQYFTPRKLVQSVIRMAALNTPTFQFDGKRFCDPFCGVGGFPLELLNMNEAMLAAYTPTAAGKIKVPFTLHGFDKGFEREEERTIILAKANMLIYLAELLFKNPTRSAEFAASFNSTFRLFKDNLATFGHIITDDAQKYDFILSNPPYVTSGSSIIKEEILRTPRTQNQYPINALGLEGLSMEWIVRSLKPGGKAFVIIPDGILARVQGKKLRDYMLAECHLDAIVSLPDRTFFANFERTYILAITKKQTPADVQTAPVFTYLTSQIGERLTSVKREEIEQDDLPEMERLFRIFSSAKEDTKDLLEKQTGRCKIQPIELFRNSHWVVDRWWNRDERIALGLEDALEAADKHEVDTMLTDFNAMLGDYDQYISADPLAECSTAEVALGDTSRFRLFIGKRVLKREVSKDDTKIPVFSANVVKPMGYIESSNLADFSHPTLLWGIDGNFEFSLMAPERPFATTDHCGAIQILDDLIVPEYVLFALHMRRMEESFDRSFRASLTNMRKFVIEIPVDADGKFDVDAQRAIAERFAVAKEKQARLADAKQRLDAVVNRYLSATHL